MLLIVRSELSVIRILSAEMISPIRVSTTSGDVQKFPVDAAQTAISAVSSGWFRIAALYRISSVEMRGRLGRT
jgi:hypothetical protein